MKDYSPRCSPDGLVFNSKSIETAYNQDDAFTTAYLETIGSRNTGLSLRAYLRLKARHALLLICC